MSSSLARFSGFFHRTGDTAGWYLRGREKPVHNLARERVELASACVNHDIRVLGGVTSFNIAIALPLFPGSLRRYLIHTASDGILSGSSIRNPRRGRGISVLRE